MDIDGQVCFHRRPFAIPVRLLRCTTGSLGPVNGINKDVSDTRLLPMTVLTYPMNCVCFCHLLKTQQCSAVCEKAYQEVQDHRLPTHYAYKVFCCAKAK